LKAHQREQHGIHANNPMLREAPECSFAQDLLETYLRKVAQAMAETHSKRLMKYAFVTPMGTSDFE
jgi:hypothetical protein